MHFFLIVVVVVVHADPGLMKSQSLALHSQIPFCGLRFAHFIRGAKKYDPSSDFVIYDLTLSALADF